MKMRPEPLTMISVTSGSRISGSIGPEKRQDDLETHHRAPRAR